MLFNISISRVFEWVFYIQCWCQCHRISISCHPNRMETGQQTKNERVEEGLESNAHC